MSMTSMSGSNNVVVIGGGAAGMMAAGTAASFGAHVTLLEPNGKLGKKLFITGKGRCNVTNNCTSDEVLKNVPVNPRFLYSALSGFSPADAMAFFEAHGCIPPTACQTILRRFSLFQAVFPPAGGGAFLGQSPSRAPAPATPFIPNFISPSASRSHRRVTACTPRRRGPTFL